MRTFSRSALVGAVASLLDLGLLALLVEGLRLSPSAANVPALLAGMFVQYVGNKRFAFGDRSRDHLRQGSAFLLVELGGFALNALAFQLLLLALPYGLARIAGSALVYVGFSYPAWRRVFSSARSPASRRSAPPGASAGPG